jgi:hypothetical protein
MLVLSNFITRSQKVDNLAHYVVLLLILLRNVVKLAQYWSVTWQMSIAVAPSAPALLWIVFQFPILLRLMLESYSKIMKVR